MARPKTGREIRTAQVNIKVKPSEKVRIERMANEMGLSIVEVIMLGLSMIEDEQRRAAPVARTGTVADFYTRAH